MRKLKVSLVAGIAAISVSGAALAQDRTARQADLTRAAAQERAAQAFERMDANSDGKIDAADRQARVKARFDRADANSDGTIDFAEYTAQRASRGERAEGARGEGRKPHGERMGRRGMRGGEMGLRGADANSDETITRDEYEAAILTRFEAADDDNDGTVTAAERKAQRDAKREQWRERRAQRAG